MITVSALHIYPVKSCRGIELQGFRFDELGPQLDRRYMVVDDQGRFITQREEPRLALVTPTLTPTAITLRAPDMPVLKLPMALHDSARMLEVQVWKHTGPAPVADVDACDWFSDWLQRKCSVVWMPRSPLRRVDPAYSPEEAFVSFSDGFPVLLVSTESLTDLSKRSPAPVPMDRFRPNIVVSGCEPYAEDTWKRIRIGEVTFDIVKPCARCVITTVDQRTAETSKEPLATLATYRKQNGGVIFGQNCVHRELGMVRVSDPVEVIAT